MAICVESSIPKPYTVNWTLKPWLLKIENDTRVYSRLEFRVQGLAHLDRGIGGEISVNPLRSGGAHGLGFSGGGGIHALTCGFSPLAHWRQGALPLGTQSPKPESLKPEP